MDINANFDEICDLYNAKWKKPLEEDQQDRLVELLKAGHHWLETGGFLPKRLETLPRPMVVMIYHQLLTDNKSNW